MNLLELIERLFSQYGYWVLLIGLPLDAIALPIPPGNTTLTYTGYLIYSGHMNGWLAVPAALIGAAAGITATYWIGFRLGSPLVGKYGHWIGLTPAKLEKTKSYYEKYGNWILLISFFLPGIRQFIGYVLGIIKVPYRTFALYGYCGALLWVSLFMGVGYGFGEQWQAAFSWAEKYMWVLLVGVSLLLGVVILRKWRGKQGKSTKFRQETVQKKQNLITKHAKIRTVKRINKP
ncbi:DedA family protein [Paenibacillus senegalensis]|uniref:DedA family protein n=1 Tax=Paenibacillus senegalensis TaxID=1465766 RepID=UPI0002882E03|nr:DedA family protein [Paenibacillus senegalensis]